MSHFQPSDQFYNSPIKGGKESFVIILVGYSIKTRGILESITARSQVVAHAVYTMTLEAVISLRQWP
jgi:hypothetical protein